MIAVVATNVRIPSSLNGFADLSVDGDLMNRLLTPSLGFTDLKVGRAGRLPASVMRSKS
jgi:hypothetical protein